jgi:hypothetical protein
MPDLLQNTQVDDTEDQPLQDMQPEERHRLLKAALAAGVFFLWDTTRHRYVSTETERLVSIQTVNRWVRDIGAGAKERMQDLARAKAAGTISGAEFELGMREEIKQLHRTMGVLAKGGKEQMTLGDWGRVGNVVARQNDYMLGFGADIARDQVSDAQLVARAGQYAEAGYSTYQNLDAVAKRDAGATLARRILDDGAEHCQDCPDLADAGWVPIEDITPIGDTECQVQCRCTIEYSTEADATEAD